MSATEVIRDPSSKREPLWIVIYQGRCLSPRFTSRGAANAYVDLIAKGIRKPEYEVG